MMRMASRTIAAASAAAMALATAAPAAVQDDAKTNTNRKFTITRQVETRPVEGKAYTVTTPAQNQVWDLFHTPPADGVGANLVAADGSLRTQLKLPDGQGLVVTAVTPNGGAAKAGLHPNDILLTLADKPLHMAGDVIDGLKKASARPGHAEDPVALTLLRGGKTITIQVKPEVRVTLGAVSDEKPEYYLGTPATPVDATLRAHLEIPGGTGLIVGEIAEDTPASKGGIKANDILLNFDGKPLPDVDTLRAKIQKSEGKPTKIQVLRGGKLIDLTVAPEPRKAEPQMAHEYETEALRGYVESMTPRLGLQLGQFTVQPLVNVQPHVIDMDRDGKLDLTFGANVAAGTSSSDLEKKIDELNAKIAELTKAVEELRKKEK